MTHPMLFRKYYRSCINCETIDEDLLYGETIGIGFKDVGASIDVDPNGNTISRTKSRRFYVVACIKCFPYAKGYWDKLNQLKEKEEKMQRDQQKQQQQE